MQAAVSSKSAFNYQYQRLMIGLIALGLPFYVTFVGCEGLESISASYHTDARDVFVGSLFAIGMLMIPYQGKKTGDSSLEFWVPKFGGVAAIFVALFPTACTKDENGKYIEEYVCSMIQSCSQANEVIHFSAAIIVFASLMILCVIFYKRAKAKNTTGSKIRAGVYGFSILSTLFGIFLVAAYKLEWFELSKTAFFRGEAMMLVSFGLAWITASQFIFWDRDKRPRLY